MEITSEASFRKRKKQKYLSVSEQEVEVLRFRDLCFLGELSSPSEDVNDEKNTVPDVQLE